HEDVLVRERELDDRIPGAAEAIFPVIGRRVELYDEPHLRSLDTLAIRVGVRGSPWQRRPVDGARRRNRVRCGAGIVADAVLVDGDRPVTGVEHGGIDAVAARARGEGPWRVAE